MKIQLRLWHLLTVQVLLLASLVWAADSRITDLTELTTGSVAQGDFVECVDVSDTTDNAAGSSRKCLVSSIGRANGGGPVYALGSDYTNNSTTGTEITGIGAMTVGAAGTYNLNCVLVIQSAATTTGAKFGVNYTGTATLVTLSWQYPSTGTTAATGVMDDVAAVNTGSLWEAAASRTATTTAPNLGPNAGVAAANQNIYTKLEGLLVVSDTGDIEVWAGSEVAASQITVKAGSFCQVRRIA